MSDNEFSDEIEYSEEEEDTTDTSDDTSDNNEDDEPGEESEEENEGVAILPPIPSISSPVVAAPSSELSILTAPKIVSVKGKKNQWGPSLENAPPDLVYIGKVSNMGGWKLPNSKWNNPYSGKKYSRQESLDNYRVYILNTPHLLNALPELSGKTLGYLSEPSHGDVLVQLFNERLLGKTTAPVPELPTGSQTVAPVIPSATTTNIPTGLGLPPLPPTSPSVTSPTSSSPSVTSPTNSIPSVTSPSAASPATKPAVPPPIPASMIVMASEPPKPTLVINQPAPSVIIQPATVPQNQPTSFAGMGALPPLNVSSPPQKVPTTKISTAKAVPKQTKLVIPKKPVQSSVSLDSLLIKSGTESEDNFAIRSAYSKAALVAFNNQINPATSVLIGRMAANKAIFGTTYPEESDRVLRYINSQIVSNPSLFI